MDLPVVKTPPKGEKVVELLQHQSLFLLSTVPVLVLDGGFGAAKTLALCAWAYTQCERYPKNLILLGRHEYTDLADSTIKSFFDLIPEGKTAKNWHEQRATYRHPNGSEILFRHLDDEAGLKNLNLGGVGIDQAEEIAPERFDLLLGRLRRPASSRQMRLTANPNGHDWLWQYFYGPDSVLWQSPHIQESSPVSPEARTGYKVIRCATQDNPYLPEDYVERMLSDYPPEYIQQYVYGSREVMLGYRFLDAAALRQQVVMTPLAVGYFVDSLPNPEWRDQEGGAVRLYERYDDRDRYALGVDTASGEGFSRSAGVLRNCRLNRVAAVLDADLRPDETAVQSWLLSRAFGGALIGPERNGLGFAVVSALHQLSGNIFSEAPTEFGVGQATSRLGWLTDARSRMALFAQLQREIAQRQIELRDAELIDQCKAITMHKGKPKAEPGFRDDLVIALGISGMLRQYRAELTANVLSVVPGGMGEGAEDLLTMPYGGGRGTLRMAGR